MQRSDVLHAVQGGLELAELAMLAEDEELAEAAFLELARLFTEARNYRAYNAQRSATFFLRPSLLWPEGAPWAQIVRHHEDSSLINFIRLDWATFRALLGHFDADWVAWLDGFTDATRSRRRQGRPTMLDAQGVLGLTLAYLSSTSSQKQLEMLFGVTHTTISDMIWAEGLPRLLQALRHMEAARVTWPSPRQQRQNAALVEATYGPCPLPARVIGFVDGVRLPTTNASHSGVQGLFYSGFEKHTNINNCLVFDPNGRVIYALLNMPGSNNDIMLARHLIMRLHDRDRTLPGHVLAADSGYISNLTATVMAHLAYAPAGVHVSAEQRAAYTRWQLTVRKAAEWGMHVLQSIFPRITVVLPGSSDKRYAILEACIRLNNVIANSMESRNQIKTVYLGCLRNDWQAAQAWADTRPER